MKGWLDNFGKADNANDSKVSMSEDFVGLGYNTEGRNYSPAWGGQFQDGGYIDSVLNANKKLDWVQRLYEENTPSIKIKGQKGKATHFMESSDGRAYPTVVRMADGKLKYLGDDAYDYADKTKTYIQFPSDREAQLFSENYKKGTNVLKDFQIGGKLNPISPTQQIQQAVEPTPTVPYLQTKDPAEFYKSWIQSPEYERRLRATGYSDVPNRWSVDKLSEIEAVKKERLGLLENIQPLQYDPSKRSEAIIDYYDGSTINVNPSDYKTFSKQSVEAHEIAHVATPQSTMGGNEFGIFMGSMLPSKKPIVSGVQGSKEREASKEAVGDFEHLQKPWEAKADLDALRFMMYDKGIYDITKGKKFTETDFEKVKQSFGKERVFKRFTDKMGKENFVKLMNTIALADDQEEAPIAMGGMSIPGSVGFSYARVAGAAPSKGKYAKKTMASAQNGIMSPMLLARNVLNYFYPSEEAAPAVEAAPVEYKKGLTNELLQRQAYKESTFNPAAVSPAGYKGLTQIGDSILKDYSKKKGGKKLDPFNPEDAVELQKFAMDDLYNASFINKPNQPDSVRIAKTLAAYNWGRGNLSNYLNEQKSKGIDIYDSYDWLNNLPKETSDYVNKILLQEDPSFNKNYKKASTNPKYEEVTSLYDQKKFGGDIPSAQNGQEMRFYQNGLDWKPKSMQPGGNIERISINDPRYPELYKNRQVGAYYDGAYSLPDLDEVTVTAKRPSLYEDLRGLTKTVEETAAEFTGVPGTIRFSKDPLENIKGLIRTGDQTGLGLVGLLPGVEQTGFNYNDQDVESAFNTLDAFGLASGVAGLVRRPIKRLPELFSHLTSPIIEMKDFDPVRLKRFDRSDINTDELINQLNEVVDQRTPVLRGYEQDNRIAELSRNIPNLREELTPIDISGVRTLEDAAATVDNWLSANRLNSELPSDLESRFEDIFQRYSIPGLRSADDAGVAGKQALREIVSAIPNRITDYELSNLRQNYGNRAFRQQEVKNRSGLTKAETLSMSKDKDKVSKMDEQEFINTVVKPSGEVVEYKTNVDKVIIDPSSQRQVLKDQVVMSDKEYADMFNDRLDLLNQIIDERNKSGVAYKVKKLTPEGKLIFETPEQSILNEEGTLVPIRSGESSWSVNLNPGQWRGEVEDVANTDYYRSIPGLEMSNTSGTVFADRNPRRGTGAYESINEYLKKLDLGRVKPGFNSQTPFSKGAWENFVNSGKAFGYYGKPSTVYGSMKTILPIGFGASYLNNETPEFKNGGVTKDNQGYWNPDNWGKPVEIDSNNITMEGVNQPLLGVSDTGDTKLMKPGKNYKFKGKKVTEFPVAKLGINQLDAQPMKKLNQLLNFTNNPDKDNWLDKYN